MTKEELRTLGSRLEAGDALARAEEDRIIEVIGSAFGDPPELRNVHADALGSTDAVLSIVAEVLPSWSIHITGHSASARGRWTCTIRETGVRDDDELIGVGKAGVLSHAVTAAILKIIQLK